MGSGTVKRWWGYWRAAVQAEAGRDRAGQGRKLALKKNVDRRAESADMACVNVDEGAALARAR